MAEKLEVGQSHRISDGNGGTLQAKIVDKGVTPPWKIYYKTRKGSKLGHGVADISLVKELVALYQQLADRKLGNSQLDSTAGEFLRR